MKKETIDIVEIFKTIPTIKEYIPLIVALFTLIACISIFKRTSMKTEHFAMLSISVLSLSFISLLFYFFNNIFDKYNEQLRKDNMEVVEKDNVAKKNTIVILQDSIVEIHKQIDAIVDDTKENYEKRIKRLVALKNKNIREYASENSTLKAKLSNSKHPFKFFGDFSKEGKAIIKKYDNKMGYIDKNTGNELVVGIYSNIKPFSEGFGATFLDKTQKWGFIDVNGNIAIEHIYSFADNFKSGKAKVKLNGQEYYINKRGEKVK